MRVTFKATHSGVESVNVASEQFLRAQQQVETGKRVRVASDDPTAAARAVGGHAAIGTMDSYTRSADSANSRLTIIDGVLSDLVDRITDAKATVGSVRGSTAPQSARDAAAARLQGLRDAIAADINTTFQGTSLFSGGQARTTSYALVSGVWTYQGDTATVTVDIGASHSVTTAMDGQAILKGGAATDLLSTLDTLITAAQANDQTALDAGLTSLQAAFDRTARAQGQVGADLQGIEAEQTHISTRRLATLKVVAKDEDADLTAAINEMTKADTAYRAALAAMGAASKLSLIDYLR